MDREYSTSGHSQRRQLRTAMIDLGHVDGSRPGEQMDEEASQLRALIRRTLARA